MSNGTRWTIFIIGVVAIGVFILFKVDDYQKYLVIKDSEITISSEDSSGSIDLLISSDYESNG